MKLNAIFNSHMVFAASLPIRVYGSGKGQAKITFAGETKNVFSNTDEWMVEFPPMDFGGPYELVFECGDEVVSLDDIYIGEVYLFSGQSNMAFKLKESKTDESEYETIDKLRLFSTSRIKDDDYYKPCDGWVKSQKEMVGEWSAIGYLTGREIVKRKNIAIGAIACYQGASIIESWIPKGALEKNGINLSIEEKSYDHIFEEYVKWNYDGALYNFALSQVIPFSITGVVWYQGESDSSTEEAEVYAKELSVMIDVWRKDFKNENLPFIIIQIANFTQRTDPAWKMIQDAQYEVQSIVPNVKTVISADVCEDNEIHPPTKDKLSKRVVTALQSITMKK